MIRLPVPNWRKSMVHAAKIGLCIAAALALAGGVVAEEQHGHAPAPRAAAHQAEAHPGPKGYQRVEEPKGWNARPATVDRGAYQHNFQAARSYHIGPYHRPAGRSSHHGGFGEVLPRAYWAPQYL